MIFDRAVQRMTNQVIPPTGGEILTLDSAAGWRVGGLDTGQNGAMKLSAVNRAVEVLSDDLSELPVYVMQEKDKQRLTDHPVARLLNLRPNEAMSAAVYKKLLECNRLMSGNAYSLILRDSRSAAPVELLPLQPSTVRLKIDDQGHVWYFCTNPRTGEVRRITQEDMLHYKAYSTDGLTGISVLSRAAEVIGAGRAMQQYESRYYTNNAQPSGVLQVDTELKSESKDKIRGEWEKVHAGADKAFRIAVLDMGLKYTPISMSQKDAQFVESKAVTVEDIARFFGVPPHKLYAGKQAYNSNEQNSIEYATGTLGPIVTHYNQEDTYKLLFDRELAQDHRVKRNLLAKLRGDTAARGAWYKAMRETGVFSVNDILSLEDMPEVPGGDTRYASLNNIPLELFEELSVARNKKEG